jgi:maleate isomerase
VRAALATLGARRVAFLTPYQPVADKEVARYLGECGFEVVRYTGLRCPTATSIADVGPDRLREVVAELDGDGVEAVLQVGTNLSMVGLADELERQLGKPVVAINAAVLWHTLRTLGLDDQMAGFGSLLREH